MQKHFLYSLLFTLCSTLSYAAVPAQPNPPIPCDNFRDPRTCLGLPCPGNLESICWKAQCECRPPQNRPDVVACSGDQATICPSVIHCKPDEEPACVDSGCRCRTIPERPQRASQPPPRQPLEQPLTIEGPTCNDENDDKFKDHSPINWDQQDRLAKKFCDAAIKETNGYMDGQSSAFEETLLDSSEVSHFFSVSWKDRCVGESFVTQRVQSPLDGTLGDPDCHSLIRSNFVDCNNGGVGGVIQA